MATSCRTFTSGFVLVCLVLCILQPHSVSGSVEGDDEIVETLFAGGRHLLQDLTPCPIIWGYENFTILTSNCPYIVTANYDKKRCCQDGLGGMLCPNISLVSDITHNDCSKSFFTTLQIVAPNYSDNFFGKLCTDPNSPLGIECPAKFLANNTPPSKSGAFSPSSRSFSSSLLLAIAILEILVLIF